MIIDLRDVNTSPGCGGFLAPPADTANGEAYQAWLRAEFDKSAGARQYMALVHRGLTVRSAACFSPTIVGPYANELTIAVETACGDGPDTTPGGRGDFAPPATLTGVADYRDWLRQRFDDDSDFRQRMSSLARQFRRWTPYCRCLGPYANELMDCLVKLGNKA